MQEVYLRIRKGSAFNRTYDYILYNEYKSKPWYEKASLEFETKNKKGEIKFEYGEDNLSHAILYRKSSTLICAQDNSVETWSEDGFKNGVYKPFVKAENSQNRAKYKKNVSSFVEDKISFSLYKTSDALPELYCFVPDGNGDYVHIIMTEEASNDAAKWYEFWKNSNNINKVYREFKDTDKADTEAAHYFKRYNKNMDYDYHTASWKDGHFGPWKERY
jgi:hypothetical protein